MKMRRKIDIASSIKEFSRKNKRYQVTKYQTRIFSTYVFMQM